MIDMVFQTTEERTDYSLTLSGHLVIPLLGQLASLEGGNKMKSLTHTSFKIKWQVD